MLSKITLMEGLYHVLHCLYSLVPYNFEFGNDLFCMQSMCAQIYTYMCVYYIYTTYINVHVLIV